MVREPRASKTSTPGNPGRRPARVDPQRKRAPAFIDDTLARTARTAGIPIVLWMCAAVVAHLAGGGGAMKAAEIVHDRDELRAAVRFVRQGMRPSDTTFELLTDTAEPAAQNVEPPKEDSANDAKPGEADPDAPKVDPLAPPPPPPPKPKDPKVELPKPEAKPEAKVEPPKPKPEPLKPLAPAAAQPAAPPPPPPPEADHRQAVKQVVKKDQADNPDSNRLADDANHTEKETVARARAQDQDSPNPSMGAHSGGPKDDPGNDKDEHSGSAEDHKGSDKHAPGENKPTAVDAEHERPQPPMPPTPREAPPPSVPGVQGKGGRGVAPAPAAPPASPGGAGPASPEVTSGDKGTYALDPVNPGGDGRSRIAGRKRPPSPFQTPVHVGALGLGGTGMPGGPQLNLNMAGVQAAVGNEQLSRERAADGEARRAAHRGKWEKNKFDKWRPAIENYEPVVQLDNVTSLNAARSPFATYLVTIHNRIHPIFAERDLEALNGLPKSHPLNDPKLYTSLEIVLAKDTGKIVRMGVTKPSGITAFDMQALSSVDAAGPFGKAPDIIASPDGNVYLHWEFHRDPFDACTTRNARPFILKSAPKKPATAGPREHKGPGPASSDDRSAPSGPLVPMNR
jgi:hypothetical protein